MASSFESGRGNATIALLVGFLSAGAVFSQKTPSDSVVSVVEDVILDAISYETDVDEPQALVQKWVRAREKIVELGPEADMALAAIIVKGLPAKREAAIIQEERKKNWRNNPAEQSPVVQNLDTLIQVASGDPALTPVLFSPLAKWWDGFVAGAPFSFSATEFEAAFYLYKWGDETMRKRLLEQVKTLQKATNPNISSVGEFLEKELGNSPHTWGVRPKGPFHEWCRERLQRDKERIAYRAANERSMEAPVKQVPPPQPPPKQPDTSAPTPNQPQPGHKNTTAWIIGLMAVLVGAGWVYRLIRRKST